MKAYRRYIRIALFFITFLGMIILPISKQSIPVQAAAVPTLSVTQATLYAGYQPHTIVIKNLSKTAKVTYKSSNTKIAKVSTKGKITPVAKGSAKITVTIKQNNKSYDYDMKVTVKNPYIEITEKTNELTVDGTYRFRAKLYGANGKILWKVSVPGIADFDGSPGVLYAYNEGTVTVTASSGKITKSYKVVVKKKPLIEFLIEGPSEMVEGETFEYVVKNIGKSVVDWWYPSDTTIAELADSYGKGQQITALKAGTVKIIAESTEGYGEKTLKVKALQLIGSSYLKVSETSSYTLNSKQMLGKVGWYIDDAEIAEITEEGNNGIKITGLQEGKTVLSAHYWTSMEDHSISIPIIVGEAPDFTISGNSVCGVIDTQEYSVNLPEGTSVEWSISDPSIADFNQYGVNTRLTAWKAGTFTLTASLGDKKASLVVTVVDDNATFVDNTDSNTKPDDPSVPSGTTVVDNGSTNTSGSGNTSGNAKKVTKNGVIYELRDTYAYVSGATQGLQSADLPSEVEGLPVSVIGKGFGKCPTLKSVTWSGNAITIEDSCFAFNTSITSISLKGKITIGKDAFASCTTLSTLGFSGEVKSVGANAFHYCTSLTTLTFPGTETVFYGQFPFRGCSSMKYMRFESKVVFADKRNEEYFFYGIWNEDIMECHVEELYLNIDQITTDRLLIYISHNLKKLTLVNTTKICGNILGTEPKALQELILPDTLTVIPRAAFAHCEGLQTVNIPSSVVKIESDAFIYCKGLQKVIIPASVTKVEHYAFGFCSSLNEVIAGVNRSREVDIKEAFYSTKFATISGCYLNNATNILSTVQYNTLQKAVSAFNTIKVTASNDYQTIKGCHDWIVNNTVYDYENFVNGTVPPESYDEMGVFLYGTAVCDGYSKAFQFLMELAGIECFRVIGVAAGDAHAWNIVRLEGNYYQVDCTWDDPAPDTGKVRYDYFLLSDSQMGKDHEWGYANDPYPDCPSDYTADDAEISEAMLRYYSDLFK